MTFQIIEKTNCLHFNGAVRIVWNAWYFATNYPFFISVIDKKNYSNPHSSRSNSVEFLEIHMETNDLCSSYYIFVRKRTIYVNKIRRKVNFQKKLFLPSTTKYNHVGQIHCTLGPPHLHPKIFFRITPKKRETSDLFAFTCSTIIPGYCATSRARPGSASTPTPISRLFSRPDQCLQLWSSPGCGACARMV